MWRQKLSKFTILRLRFMAAISSWKMRVMSCKFCIIWRFSWICAWEALIIIARLFSTKFITLFCQLSVFNRAFCNLRRFLWVGTENNKFKTCLQRVIDHVSFELLSGNVSSINSGTNASPTSLGARNGKPYMYSLSPLSNSTVGIAIYSACSPGLRICSNSAWLNFQIWIVCLCVLSV